MSKKNFIDYDDARGLVTKIKTELNKKPNVVAITQAQYDLLTSEQKHNGTLYFITDYHDNGTPNFIVKGYYNSTDGKFYNEALFTTEITNKNADYLYIDLGSNKIYCYDTTNGFYMCGGGNMPIAMATSLPTSAETGDKILYVGPSVIEYVPLPCGQTEMGYPYFNAGTSLVGQYYDLYKYNSSTETYVANTDTVAVDGTVYYGKILKYRTGVVYQAYVYQPGAPATWSVADPDDAPISKQTIDNILNRW